MPGDQCLSSSLCDDSEPGLVSPGEDPGEEEGEVRGASGGEAGVGGRTVRCPTTRGLGRGAGRMLAIGGGG